MKYKTIHIYGLSICTGPPRDPKRAVDQSERESEFAWSACCAALVKRTLQWISVCDGDSVLRNFWGAGRARAHYNKLKASSRKQRLGEIWLWIFSSHFFVHFIFFPVVPALTFRNNVLSFSRSSSLNLLSRLLFDEEQLKSQDGLETFAVFSWSDISA